MNILRLLSITFFCLTTVIKPQVLEIKSLKAYSGDDESSFPVIIFDDSTSRLTIEFDLAAEYIPSFNIIFKFCDKEWNPYSNLFLIDQFYNTDYNLKFERLPAVVAGADYHFKDSYPNEEVSFSFSGKWRFFIVDTHDTSKIYGSGKFYAVKKDLEMKVSLQKETLQDRLYFPAELANTFNITSQFYLPPKFFPVYVNFVEVIENKKIDYPIRVNRVINDYYRFYNWDGNRNFSFTARDVRPGNEYRQTDFRNYNKFNTREINSQFDGIETSRFYKSGTRDLNGGSILTNYKNEFADYHQVTFRIRPPEKISKKIFLVGSFNNWKVIPEYALTDDSGLYKISVELKRGIYDYAYVLGDAIGSQIENLDWYYLEGNFLATGSEYNIFLYYNEPELGGYDKIIGYYKLKSK